MRTLPRCLLLLALLLAPAGCTSVRPTIKIGLIGSFEGLHRRSGYSALEAVRAAIADFPYSAAGILPLALDDAGDPAQVQRTAQKLHADPEVAAIVGPLTPALAAAAKATLAPSSIPWFAAFAPPDATHAKDPDTWALMLVSEAGRLARLQGAQSLALAGWTPGWPDLSTAQWAQTAGMPVRINDAPDDIKATEAVFWMGSPEDGASYLAQMRRRQPAAPFWMGPAGADPVFAERAVGVDRVYWLIWTDPGYNDWAATHPAPSPTAYLTYKAARAALYAATGSPAAAPDAGWYVQAYAAGPNGTSAPYVP